MLDIAEEYPSALRIFVVGFAMPNVFDPEHFLAMIAEPDRKTALNSLVIAFFAIVTIFAK